MISCIICSRYSDISVELKENIASTIGCEYELIVINNSMNEYSIFSAYNEGVRKSKGDILCFMHEDILYHTNNWGDNIHKYFMEYPTAGLVGTAGTHFLSIYPSGWWELNVSSMNLIQGFFENNIYKTNLCTLDKYKQKPTSVVAVDGFWMCTPRFIFNIIKWDDKTFNGFHGYDIDFSLQVWKAGLEVHVIWDVLIEHKSMGLVDTIFDKTYEGLWNKWKDYFPIEKGVKLSKTEMDARTEIAELKKIIRMQTFKMNDFYDSYTYKVGAIVLYPIKIIKKWFKL